MTNAEFEALRDEFRFESQEAVERAYYKLYAEWQARGREMDKLAKRIRHLKLAIKKLKADLYDYTPPAPKSVPFMATRNMR